MVVLAVTDAAGERVVTVVPVTHSEPASPDEAVEIPPATKRRLGLDEARSWIVASEANRFVWPGPDLRPIAPGRFDYGFLPPALFQRVLRLVASHVAARRLPTVPRAE